MSSLNLEANCRTERRLTGEDGRIGALHEKTFITSLFDFSILIPTPPSTSIVKVDANGRFGEHDFMLWPQMYSPERPHLAIMPVMPAADEVENPYHRYLCMWKDVSDEDIDWVGNSALSGVGLLKPLVFASFKTAVNWVVEQARDYVETSQASPNFTKFVDLRVARLKAFKDRLTSSRADLLSMRITVTSLQRLWFDLETAIRYMKYYQPLMNGKEQVDSAVLNVKLLGAFTNQLDVVEMFRLARCPIYYIRPISLFSQQVILHQTGLRPYPDFVAPTVSLPSVFSGPPDHPFKLFAIYQFGARFLATKYTPYTFSTISVDGNSVAPASLFGTHMVSRLVGENTPPPSSAGPSRHRSSASIQRHEENRGGHPGVTKIGRPPVSASWFEELSGPDVPPAIPAWKNGNSHIDPNSTRFSDQRDRLHTYSFPPPSLFTKANPRRQDIYYLQLAHLLSAFKFRVESPFTSGSALQTQGWRDLLSLSTARTVQAGEPSTHAQSQFASAKNLLGKCFDLQGVHLEFVAPPRNITTGERSSLLWEICELNFRSDLLRLDSRLRNGLSANSAEPDSDAVHEELLLKVFPELSLTTVNANLTPLGLSSSDWGSRRHRLVHLRDLMGEWTVSLPDVLVGLPPPVSSPQATHQAWEEHLIRHFVQLFFDCFGRSPVLPRARP
ncbi:hypothetical protein AAF712_012284 [Marasmius tenuissimus]|uniref:UDENN domain-containing protein n=1 Tax=Marasmius tenuissimus TaxID=585030 RepID=A0ABR2ZIY9_9AGAR